MGLPLLLKELYDIKTDIWSALCEIREETITKSFVEFPGLIEPKYIIMPGSYWSPRKQYYTQVGKEIVDGKLYLVYQCEFDPDGEHLVMDLCTECIDTKLTNAELTDTPPLVENPEEYSCLYVSNQADVSGSDVLVTSEFNINFRGYEEFTVYVSVYADNSSIHTASVYLDGKTSSGKTVSAKVANQGADRTYTEINFTDLDYDEHTITVKYLSTIYYPNCKTWVYYKLPVEPDEPVDPESNAEI